MRPRFWTPYAARVSAEWRFGAVTGGADPLLRQAYGLDAHYGEASGRLGFNAFYLYDRFRPQLSLVAENTTETDDGGVQLRTQGLALRSSYPLTRRRDASQSLSLSWRFKRESLAGAREEDDIDLSGVELGWTWSGTRQFPYSISTHEGSRLRVALLQELEALGSDVSLAKGVVDARTYIRGPGASDVLALRMGAGTTFGRPGFRRSYAVGGFPQGSLQDIVATNPVVLRGYPDRAFSGRSFVGGNAEYRFALAHPQAGLRSLPVFLRHLHASLFADAAHAWSDDFRLKDVKTSVGAALGADIFLGHVLPVTGTIGLARGLAERGDTQVYFRTGLAF
jgi:hemolysin activation/secretion protein